MLLWLYAIILYILHLQLRLRFSFLPKLWGSFYKELDVFTFGKKDNLSHAKYNTFRVSFQHFSLLVWNRKAKTVGKDFLYLFRLLKYLSLLHERMLNTVMWQRICLVHQIFCLGTFVPPVFTMRHLQFLVVTLFLNKPLPYYYYTPNVNYSAVPTINHRMNCPAV